VVCQFPLSANSGKPIAATNYRTGYPAENAEKSAMNVNELSAVILRSGSPMFIKKPNIFT
jgi:hypothetical protein